MSSPAAYDLAPGSLPPRPRALPAWVAPLFFLALAVLFLWRSTVAGDVFLPADLLARVAPWSSAPHPDSLPPWNPLRWDGIGQFYPWRYYAAQSVRAGTVPLWNPYQFCGTPFVANSQSAVFYPLNLFFYLLPTARAFALSAVTHLTLCGWFMYLFLRRLGCRDASALLGGVVYAYSAWQVNWLQLPTFLAASCWFPLLLRQIYEAGKEGRGKEGRSSIREEGRQDRENNLSSAAFPSFPPSLLPLSLTVGMMLLAGHLQIAFYGLLAGSLWAIALLVVRARQHGRGFAAARLGVLAAGLMLGAMLALPQILPALELSRVSHRVGKPSGAGYALYVEYALPPGGLVMLMLPEFFGNDYDANNPYYGFYVKQLGGGQNIAIRHNAAETAVYVGIVPLMLALLAVARQLTRTDAANKRVVDRRVIFFAGLAVLALLLALGTPIDALFYFLVPGFGQSGSPARCLVLWTLAIAVLAAFGLDALLDGAVTKREVGATVGVFVFILAIGLGLASQMLRTDAINMAESKVPMLSDVFGRIGVGWGRLLLLMASGIGLLLTRARAAKASDIQAASAPAIRNVVFPLPALFALALVVVDLLWTGINVNPTAQPEAVYPVTPGIRYVQEHVGHEHIAPINRFWSLYKAPPVVLPPNGAMVYGLRDAQGYDSLLTGQYKTFANTLARPKTDGSIDASPPEVGNMVFIQDPDAANLSYMGIAFALTLPASFPNFERVAAAPQGDAVYTADGDVAVYPLPLTQPRAFYQTELGAYAQSPAPITYEEDGPTRVTLRLNAAAAPNTMLALLVLSDQYYPGWHVTVDGRPTPIERGGPNGIFRAVLVAGGEHRVAFRYEPASYRVGLYLACLSALLLSLLTGVKVASGRQT